MYKFYHVCDAQRCYWHLHQTTPRGEREQKSCIKFGNHLDTMLIQG
jgi:hypothetical protein